MPAKRDKSTPKRRKPGTPRRRLKFDPDDPHWIPRIHDYCDRWCERCEFSHRCFRFAVTERILGTSIQKAASGTSVVDALTRIVAESRHDLASIGRRDRRAADDRGVAAQIAAEKRIQRKALTAANARPTPRTPTSGSWTSGSTTRSNSP